MGVGALLRLNRESRENREPARGCKCPLPSGNAFVQATASWVGRLEHLSLTRVRRPAYIITTPYLFRGGKRYAKKGLK